MRNTRLLAGPPGANGGSIPGNIVPRQYFDAPPGPPPVVEQEEDGLITYIRVLKRHKGLLLLAGTLGMIAGILLTIPQTPVYEATTAIAIQGLNDNFLDMKNLSTTVSASWDPSFDIQTQVREMQSGRLAERVLKRLNSTEGITLTPDKSRLSAWRKALHLGKQKTLSVQDVISSVVLKIKPSISSRIVEVSCESVDPKIAALYANTLVDEYRQLSLDNRIEDMQRTENWLTTQIQQLKIKLENSEDELQRYMNNAGLMFINGEAKEKENVAEEKLRQLQAEALKAEADRVTKQSEYELIKKSSTDALPEVLDDKGLDELKGKLTELHRQLADLNFALTPDNPKVKRLQSQIDIVEGALKKARADIVARITNDYEAAMKREELLTNALKAQKDIVQDQASKVSHYNILKREADTNREIYQSMLQRVKESSVVSAIKSSGIRVVDAAVAPGSPFKPVVSRNAMFGLMVGMFLGVGLVTLRERSNRNLQQPGDSAFYLNIPELGVIPTSNTDPVKGERGMQVEEELLIRPELDLVELVTWNRKFSLLAESFRTTLTSLLFSGRNGEEPRIIVLTSANPSEGKTTVTINLAIALAEINRRVLLIDADMRRPRLHNLFELGPGPGLTELLREKTSPDSITLDKAVCATAIPGLFVMRSGRNSGVVSNLLHSSRLPELIEQLRNQFDTVVIDTPPALHLSDARVLGRLADAVLLIVRAGQTSRDAALMVKQRFNEDGTILHGTILNGWDPKHDVYGYKYRYYNGNGAYSRNEADPDKG